MTEKKLPNDDTNGLGANDIDWELLLLFMLTGAFGPVDAEEENQNGGKEEMKENRCSCEEKKNNPVTLEDLKNRMLTELGKRDLSHAQLCEIKELAETLKVVSEIQTKSIFDYLKETSQTNYCCAPPLSTNPFSTDNTNGGACPESVKEFSTPTRDVFINFNNT